MLSFQLAEESWLSRSLLVIEGYVLLCVEDIKQLYSLSSDASMSPYFRVDSCCSITDITEMVSVFLFEEKKKRGRRKKIRGGVIKVMLKIPEGFELLMLLQSSS